MVELINVVEKQVGDYVYNTEINEIVNKSNLAIEELNNLPAPPSVPTKLSELENDTEFITENDIPALPTVPTKLSELENDAEFITENDIPAPPSVPTKLSELENDTEFVTTNDLPAVPTSEIVEWVTGQAKPTIVANVVIGEFFEGKKHLVTTSAVGKDVVKMIEVQNWLSADFICSLTEDIYSTAVVSNEKIIVGGNFAGHLKRLNSDGTIDSSFNPLIDDSVVAIAIDSSDKIVIGGAFTGFLARLNSDGTVDSSFTPVLDNFVNIIAIDSNDKIVIGGAFNGQLKRLNYDGTVDSSFTPPLFEETPYVIKFDSNLKIIIGGGASFCVLKRLNYDGTVDSSFTPVFSSNDRIMAAAIDSSDKIVIGGSFLKRLNSNGTVDSSFTNTSFNVKTILFVGASSGDSGGIFVGGGWGNTTGYVRRINSDGSLNTTLNVTVDGVVNSIIKYGYTGKIIINGLFAGHLKRLNSDGTEGTVERSFIGDLIDRVKALENA